MIEILYVALPSGILPSLFNENPRVQDGPAPGGVLGSNHRNTKEHIQKTSSPEALGLDACNSVRSIA